MLLTIYSNYMAYKGFFKPQNPSKYKGNPTNIVYRSRWELIFMGYLDKNSSIIEWSSEEMYIPYKSPVDNKVHRYFPDFIFKRKKQDGNLGTVMVEIKPKAQTRAPEVLSKPNRRYIQEVYTWGINTSKWKAAKEYCLDHGWEFVIITEDELGIKF